MTIPNTTEITSFTNPALGPLPTSAPELATSVLDLFSLKGKVASVTGSSTGIGYAVAEAFAQAGADVAIWYNNHPATEKAEKLAKKYGVKCRAYKCNISNADDVDSTIKQIEQDFGTIDIFVANAGVAWTSGSMVDVDDNHESWHKIVDLDLNGVYYCCHSIGKVFKRKGKGSLVITSSMSGSIVNVPQLQAPYNAAKAAVKHLAKSLAVEWAPFARVNSISPGYITTDISEFADPEMKARWWQLTPLGREGLPQELVGAYLYLASNASTFTTGADLVVDGGYTAP
ncbi:carbonyl reductase [Spathaspora passalidarum NRRL Y-27907]|uniref:Carbonyl reductase n=1 Tax=Spathaspora passalidarum (strain NRRL Y-27907 / 11-Y1) TaxID=619300 RepID=G3AET3_SPAPN|nr:carbonyl reductase [Spathaspora passalidarum NRRL Y-27907]EGW35762.1 carbonyl reductase [Spathaspora passalidarum NRRL Y-27907]